MKVIVQWRLLSGAALVLGLLALAACGDVEVATGVDFPKPLVEQLPMKVGVYYSDEFRKYQHSEGRWGVDWKVDLGRFHVRMGDKLFEAAFRETVPVSSLTDLPKEPVRAIVEPRIEQYSFITPRDTGAKYYAVTIRYRLNVFAPDGQLADSLTFTGYGSAPAGGMTSTSPMIAATKNAMRDAAAKFLVQFPEQPVTKRMIASLPLIETPVAGESVAGGTASAAGGALVIETVPIEDTAPAHTPGSATPPAGTSESTPGATTTPEKPTPETTAPGTPPPRTTPPETTPPETTPPETTPPGTTPPETTPPGTTPPETTTPSTTTPGSADPASAPPKDAPPSSPKQDAPPAAPGEPSASPPKSDSLKPPPDPKPGDGPRRYTGGDATQSV